MSNLINTPNAFQLLLNVVILVAVGAVGFRAQRRFWRRLRRIGRGPAG